MRAHNFSSIIEFLDYLPEEERQITNCLREIVFETIPEIKERLSYQVPLFKLNKTILTIWPSSILWGRAKSYSGVRMGFWYGYKLVENSDLLILGERKLIAHHDFHSLEEVEAKYEEIRRLLRESSGWI